MFNRVIRFILENLGKNFSAKTIFDFFKSQHRSIAIETMYREFLKTSVFRSFP